MSVYIPKEKIEEVIKQAPIQGKRELEPFKTEMKNLGVPISIVEDTQVSNNTAEVHKKSADLWYCLNGEATFIVGGELENSKAKVNKDGSENNDEWRSETIIGGHEVILKAGDWLYIPAGEPHTHRAKGTARFLIIKIPAQN